MKTRTFLVLAVCIAILAFAFQMSTVKAKPLPKGNVTGTVTDAVTGLPIEGAYVAISADIADWTTASGSYNLGGVNAGDYTVTVSQTGYATQTISVTISSGATTVQDFALVPPLNTVPEVPLGTLAVSLTMIGALAGYITIPKLRKRK